MKTYYVYWTPQRHMIAKVEAETAEEAYKAAAGVPHDFKKAWVIYEEVQEEDMTSYDVYEDSEDHETTTFRGTFCDY